jgi:hypothetical protein
MKAVSNKRRLQKTEGGMFCSQCGFQSASDAKFCSNCGNQLASEKQTEAATVTTPSFTNVTMPKKKMATWKKVVLGGVVFIILVISVALYATSGLLVPINAQLEALRAGNIRGAYEQTSSAFQQTTSYEQFTAFVKAYPGLFKNKETSFSDRSWEGSQGHVKGTLIDDSGGVIPIEYRLVKENGKWMILGINMN